MSNRAGGIARALVRLYPRAWRSRYEQEMLALLEDDPPGARGVLTLLAGAGEAHLRPRDPWRVAAPPASRLGASVSGIFACWIALSLAGAAFQRVTEDPPYGAVDGDRTLLGIAHGAVIAGALLGAGVIALAGLPLVWRALRQAHVERDVWLALAIGLAPVAIACFAVLTAAILALTGPSEEARPPLSAAWFAAGLLCALACALAPRLALLRMGRSGGPSRPLVRASRLGAALALAMALVTAGIALYAISLSQLEPGLWARSTGPRAASTSTGAVLIGAAALAALSTALGAFGAARARRAAASM